MIRVLIVDDHQIVGEGTKNMIELEEDMQAEYILNEQEALIKVTLHLLTYTS